MKQRPPKRKQAAGFRVPAELRAWQDRYVTVAGEVAAVAIETAVDERKIDHVWITVRAGDFGRVQISLSTCSRQSWAAGLDPRLRIAHSTTPWEQLPAAGLRETAPLDYRTWEAAQPLLTYTPHERRAVEDLFVACARRAIFVEAWGDLYLRAHIGVHQVHSRRASLAVPRDVIGRDGAVQFYYREPNVRELLLLKFAGQP